MPSLLGQLPGLVLVYIGVHAVGQQHGLAQGLAVFALGSSSMTDGATVRRWSSSASPSAETSPSAPPKRLADEPGRAAGDVDVFADQIAVDAQP
jgi:hypothetical protein